MMKLTPESLLKSVFGYDQFHPLQREIIENVLLRRDTLVVMPTGSGKSLCYQIPALIFPGLTVVVSPLIALMQDQVTQLCELGVPALFLNSSLTPEEYRENISQVRNGKIKLLYVAPETLLMQRTFDLLDSVPLDCLAIDEAHCISEWGHDFRPEYRQLMVARKRFANIVYMALTATATPRVREDIKTSLGFMDSNEFIASFNRENLLIEVVPKTDPLEQTLTFLRRYSGQSGIIYCFSRRQVDDLSVALAARGYAVRPYHAGLEDSERRKNQEGFIRDDVQIIVATIAFGMGINKPNVRFVLHYDLPKSIEGYYQEIGRAGRDGLPAHCLLLYSYGDIQKLKYFIDQKEGLERQVAYEHLNALTRYGDSDICRRVPLLGYFGEKFGAENCGMCDNCLAGEKEQVDITIPAQKFLSCVKRTGERFGMVHVTDVLLGSENQKVLKFGHHNISTYGIGKDLTREQWMLVARQLTQKELLVQDEHGSLRITQKAYDALKNRETILGILEKPKPAGQARKLTHDRDLFDILRGKRKALADKAGIPPYVIFSDRTLVEMSTYFPLSVESLMDISGVGAVKLQRYGRIFLELIQAYCAHRGISEKPKRAEKGNERSDRQEMGANLPGANRLRHTVIGEAYNTGKSLNELMEEYRVKAVTIMDHLTRYALEGNQLRPAEDVRQLSRLSEMAQETVLSAIASEGVGTLRPIYDRLNGAIPFEEIKILRLYYLSITH